jgi:hypothetical protein
MIKKSLPPIGAAFYHPDFPELEEARHSPFSRLKKNAPQFSHEK